MPQNHVNSYCRVVRLKGDPNKVDEAVKLWTQEILPLLKKQKGFAGATLVGNRETGDGLSVSYWQSEATMKEARGQVRPEAIKILSKTGGSMIEDDVRGGNSALAYISALAERRADLFPAAGSPVSSVRA